MANDSKELIWDSTDHAMLGVALYQQLSDPKHHQTSTLGALPLTEVIKGNFRVPDGVSSALSQARSVIGSLMGATGTEEALESTGLKGWTKAGTPMALVWNGMRAVYDFSQGDAEAGMHQAVGGLGGFCGNVMAGIIFGLPSGPGATIVGLAGGLIGSFTGSKGIDLVEYLAQDDPAQIRKHAQMHAAFQAGLMSGDESKARAAKDQYISTFTYAGQTGLLSITGRLMPNPATEYANRAYAEAASHDFKPPTKKEMLDRLPSVTKGFQAALSMMNGALATEAYGEYVSYLFTLDSMGVDRNTSEELKHSFVKASSEFQKQYSKEYSRLAAAAQSGTHGQLEMIEFLDHVVGAPPLARGTKHRVTLPKMP